MSTPPSAATRAGPGTADSPPGGRLMLALLAGRGAFRVTAQLAPLALVGHWGAAGFADYASAVGISAWTVFVAGSGEKAALKLVPRARRLAPAVARIVVRIAAAPVAVAAVLVALSVLRGTDRLLATALLCSTGLGLLQVAVGLHRVRGRVYRDSVTYLVMTGVVVALTAVTFALGWSPRAQLSLLAGAALAAAVVLLLLLPAGWVLPHGGAAPRSIARIVLRTSALLGLPEFISSVSVSVCYLALRLSGERAGSGPFYVAMTVAGFCTAGLLYLMRLRQPATSLLLRGPGGRLGRRRARRVLRVAFAVCAAGAVLLVAVPAGHLLLALLTGLEVALFGLVSYAGFLVENTDGRSPVLTAASAVAGLLVLVLAAVLLVPATASAGAMGALLLSSGATALVLYGGLGALRR
jgi:hypothetical protein